MRIYMLQTHRESIPQLGANPFGSWLTPAHLSETPVAPRDKRRADKMHRGASIKVNVEVGRDVHTFQLTRVR